MKAVQIKQYGGPEVIEINDIQKPTPNPNQVLVAVKAAAINPFDYKLRSGASQESIPLQFPITIGADFAGVIEAVGMDVNDFTVGQAVYGSAIVLNGGSGALADFAAANAANIAIKPAKLNFEQSAAMVLVGISAFSALDAIGLSNGQKLLIQGGAGGIGSAAIQYAKHFGAHVTATARGTDQEFVSKLGADEVVNYETQDITSLTADFDAVFDTVGGDTYTNSFKVIKRGGKIISMNEQPNADLMAQYGVEALHQNTSVNTDTLNKLSNLLDDGIIAPQIDKTFPLDQTSAAFTYLETGHPRGKVVITISSVEKESEVKSLK